MEKHKKMIKHCIFDFDGTLVSSMDVVVWGMKTVLTEFLEREITEKELVENFDADIGVIFDAFKVSDHTDRMNVLNHWRKVTCPTKIKYPLFDGIHQMIENLNREGYHLHIWTARDRRTTLAILESLNLQNSFKNIWTSSDGPIKPHPYGINKILGKELKQPSKHKMIMVGDSHMDVWAAKNANIPSIGVHWCPVASSDNLRKQGASYLTNSVTECEELIHQHFKGKRKHV